MKKRPAAPRKAPPRTRAKASPPPPSAGRRCSATTKAGEPCTTTAPAGRDLCAIHDPELSRAGRSAGGKARLAGGPLVLPKEEAEQLGVGGFREARATLDAVVRAVAGGRLDFRIANAVTLAVQASVAMSKAEEDQVERVTKRAANLSDEQLDAEIAELIEKAAHRKEAMS